MASQKKKKPSELKMTPQTFDKMNLTASGIVGVVETLRNKLNVLDGEIYFLEETPSPTEENQF